MSRPRGSCHLCPGEAEWRSMGEFVYPQHVPSAILACPWVPTKTARLLFLNISLHMASVPCRAPVAGKGLSERTQRGELAALCNLQNSARGSDDAAILSLETQRTTATTLSCRLAVLQQLEPTNLATKCSTHVAKIPATLNHQCLNPRFCSARGLTFQTHFGLNDLEKVWRFT